MSNKLNQTVIGIDIGSFTAKIAAVQRGAIDVITN
jgi:activator of 2-hydroxyglutaryl-CoA dehydratase